MNISFSCNCGKKLLAPIRMAGTRATCPRCRAPLTVPVPDSRFSKDVPPVNVESSTASTPDVEHPRKRKNRRLLTAGFGFVTLVLIGGFVIWSIGWAEPKVEVVFWETGQTNARLKGGGKLPDVYHTLFIRIRGPIDWFEDLRKTDSGVSIVSYDFKRGDFLLRIGQEMTVQPFPMFVGECKTEVDGMIDCTLQFFPQKEEFKNCQLKFQDLDMIPLDESKRLTKKLDNAVKDVSR